MDHTLRRVRKDIILPSSWAHEILPLNWKQFSGCSCCLCCLSAVYYYFSCVFVWASMRD